MKVAAQHMQTEITVLTGPESCGKSTLAKLLAENWQSPLVDEFSRSYLADKPSYTEQDLLQIAKQQQQWEIDALVHTPSKLVCDTDLLVIMIWSEVKYGQCDPWIIKTFEDEQSNQSTNRIYCLCDYQVPWQPDPLRENPDDRDELFDLYKAKLDFYSLNYCIAKGNPEERLQQVLVHTNS